MITHPAHVENARRALTAFDRSVGSAELGRNAVKAASALRVLLHEPADGFQGHHVESETEYLDRICDGAS